MAQGVKVSDKEQQAEVPPKGYIRFEQNDEGNFQVTSNVQGWELFLLKWARQYREEHL